MFLFLVFVVEYTLGEIAYFYLDGWFFFGDWIDFNASYYISICIIDIAVMSVLLNDNPKELEIAYAALATLSFFINLGGFFIYLTDAKDYIYLTAIRLILMLKLAIIFHRTICNAGLYARNIAVRFLGRMVNSVACLYLWEMVKTNQKKG